MEFILENLDIRNVTVEITTFNYTKYQSRILFLFEILGCNYSYDVYTFKTNKKASIMVEPKGGNSERPQFSFAQRKRITKYLRDNRDELLKKLVTHPDVRFSLLHLKEKIHE